MSLEFKEEEKDVEVEEEGKELLEEEEKVEKNDIVRSAQKIS